MKILFDYVLGMSLLGSLMTIIYFILLKLFLDKINQKWRYYFGIIVVLLFLIPLNWVYIESKNQQIITETNTIMAIELQEFTRISIYNNKEYHKLIYYVKYIWIIGSIVSFLKCITNYFKFRYNLRSYTKHIRSDYMSLYKNICKLEKINRPPVLYRNDCISSPMIVGLLKPIIIIPDYEYSREKLKYIFKHELYHYKYLDIWVKVMTQIIVCIHWFNPIIYFLQKKINILSDLACDERVIEKLNNLEKEEYGDTLLENIDHINNTCMLALSSYSKNIKERLRAIMKYKKKNNIIIICILACLFIISAVCIGRYFYPNKESNKNTELENVDFEEYKAYGIEYDKDTDKLYFDNVLVRCFEDIYYLEDNTSTGLRHYTQSGEIDVYCVRDVESELNPRGSIKNIEVCSQDEFDKKDLSLFDESKSGPLSSSSNNMDQEYAQYSDFELIYENGDLFYKGELVRYFEDILKYDGKQPIEIRKSTNLSGTVDVHAFRNDDGEIESVVPYTQSEYDMRTKNWEISNEINSDNTAE